MGEHGDIDVLARRYGEWLSEIPSASDSLAAGMFENSGWAPGVPTLRRMRIILRMTIAEESKQLVFFVRRRASQETGLDASLTAEVSPSARPLERTEFGAQDIPVSLVTPPFLELRPTDSQLDELAFGRSERERTELFTLGNDQWLAIWSRKTLLSHKVRAKLWTAGVAREGDWSSALALWAARPLVRAMTRWARNDFEGTHNRLGLVFRRMVEPSESDQLLAALVDAFAKARVAMIRESSPAGLLRRMLTTEYSLSRYEGEVTLRLDENGEIAFEGDDTVQVRFTVRTTEGEHGPRVTVTPAPPDFLASGGLHEAFLAAIREQAVIFDLTDAIRAKLPAITTEETAAFVARAAESATVFRSVRNHDGDWNVFALSGLLLGEERLVVFKCYVRVTEQDGWNVELLKDPEIIHVGLLSDDSGMLDSQTTRYFLRMTSALGTWRRLLP